MRIINSAFISLDGVTEDPGSWAISDPDSAEEAVHALKAYDGMLIGRGTYEYFADIDTVHARRAPMVPVDSSLRR
jgi:hypothetical protein